MSTVCKRPSGIELVGVADRDGLPDPPADGGGAGRCDRKARPAESVNAFSGQPTEILYDAADRDVQSYWHTAHGSAVGPTREHDDRRLRGPVLADAVGCRRDRNRQRELGRAGE